MAKQQETPIRERTEIFQIMGEIAERSQKLMHELAERRCSGNGEAGPADPLNLAPTMLKLTTRMLADPANLMQAQLISGRATGSSGRPPAGACSGRRSSR